GRAALYDVIDLGYLPNSDSGTRGSGGYGIDNAGEAAASSNISIFVTHGMFWNGTTASDIDPTHPTANSYVHGMGPAGQVVGENGTGFAFIWTQSGGYTNLPNLGGTTGAAFGANAAGDVVGIDTNALVNAVVWKTGYSSVTRLDPAIDPSTSSQFFYA